LLDIPVAQCEPEIKPDRMLDDRRREAMSAVGDWIHGGSLPCRGIPSSPISVTMPHLAILETRNRDSLNLPSLCDMLSCRNGLGRLKADQKPSLHQAFSFHLDPAPRFQKEFMLQLFIGFL